MHTAWRDVELLLPSGCLKHKVYPAMDVINRSAVIVMAAEAFLKWYSGPIPQVAS